MNDPSPSSRPPARRGRPPRSSPRQRRLRALELFWRKGYGEVTVADLATGADINRFTLYARHGGKEGLFREVLDLYRREIMADFTAPLDRSDAGLEAIHAFFAAFRGRLADPRSRLGCLICATLAEGPRLDPALRREMVGAMESLRARFRRALEHARASGRMDPERDPDRLAGHLTVALLGLMAALRSPLPRSYAEDHLDTVLRFVESLGSFDPSPELAERMRRWPRAGE